MTTQLKSPVPPDADAEPSQAAEAWLRLAQEPASDFDPAVAWAEYGRCCISLQRLTDAETALNRALEIKPDYMLPHKLLGWVGAERQDWRSVLEHWRIVLAADLNPAERMEALNAVAKAYIYLGMFDEAENAIERLAGYTDNNADGQQAALGLRTAMALERLDEEFIRESWRGFEERSPEAAAGSAAYLAFIGGEEYENPRFTPDDLRKAPDVRAAGLILAYLVSRPRGEYINLLREAVERFPVESSPEAKTLHTNFIRTLGYDLASKTELEELKVRAAAFQDPIKNWRIMAAVGVAANDHAAVASLVEATASRLGPHAELDKLRRWLAAAAGDHDEAYDITRRIRRNRYVFGEDNRGLDLRLVNNPPHWHKERQKQDRILLFANVRNEHLFLPWFLDYYRSIGVEWFFIIDNLSNDGTIEYISTQKDVTLFSSTDDYKTALSGIRWTNELIRRYGQDNWCVSVDTDEQLVLPDHENSTTPLRAAVDGMAARGEEVMPTYMLDTFPQDMAALKGFQPGDEPITVSSLIDPNYYFSGSASCCFFKVRGGARHRLFNIREQLEKASIIRGGGDNGDGKFTRLYRIIHNINYGRVSSQCAALLHHKLLREALELLQPHPDHRLENLLPGRRQMHKDYRRSGLLDTDAHIPRSPDTVTYQNSAQLQELGLLGDFAAIRKSQ